MGYRPVTRDTDDRDKNYHRAYYDRRPTVSRMATANDVFDEFLEDRGHETETRSWERDYNKKRCPDCGGLHGLDAPSCSVCGWRPN